MKTTARALALSIVSVLALAGCMKIDMDLTLNTDDTMSGSVIMAVEEGTGESLGLSDEELAEQMFADTESDLPSGTVEEYNTDGYIGQKTSFEDTPLTEFGATTDGMRIYRDEDDYVVESDAPFNEGTDLSELPQTAEATMSVTFPGEVHETNGTLEGTTVTWNLFEMDEAVYARGSASASSGISVWLILAIGLALGALIGIVLRVTLRRKGGDGADAVAEGDPTFAGSSRTAPALGGATMNQPVPPATADVAAGEDITVEPDAPTPEMSDDPVATGAEAVPHDAPGSGDAQAPQDGDLSGDTPAPHDTEASDDEPREK